MTSKKEIKLLTELRELSGVKVVSRHQHKGIGILLQVEPIKEGKYLSSLWAKKP